MPKPYKQVKKRLTIREYNKRAAIILESNTDETTDTPVTPPEIMDTPLTILQQSGQSTELFTLEKSDGSGVSFDISNVTQSYILQLPESSNDLAMLAT